MNKIFVKLNVYTQTQVLAIGVVFSLIFYFFIFDDGQEIRNQISGLEQEMIQEKAKKEETDRTLAEEARMKESVEILSQKYLELSQRLPTSLNSIDLNRNVDAFARNAGVSIKNRKPVEVQKGTIVDEVPIEVSVEGTFAELAQFVYVVASSQQVTALRAFKISPIEKSSRLTFEGTVIGYQIAAPPPPTAEPGASTDGDPPAEGAP